MRINCLQVSGKPAAPGAHAFQVNFRTERTSSYGVAVDVEASRYAWSRAYA